MMTHHNHSSFFGTWCSFKFDTFSINPGFIITKWLKWKTSCIGTRIILFWNTLSSITFSIYERPSYHLYQVNCKNELKTLWCLFGIYGITMLWILKKKQNGKWLCWNYILLNSKKSTYLCKKKLTRLSLMYI